MDVQDTKPQYWVAGCGRHADGGIEGWGEPEESWSLTVEEGFEVLLIAIGS